ncbi:hypothetical protein FOZ60_011503 [Perkinsus olseni]|uniref:RING-type domain-containing protein n=1 Tax=Perkinsus olseni TaxID=32597 RepID=A0A7J6PAY1_PEROL|nr:hypothetical protein FOZ60_011503 [Perkinsus olseni]
MNITTTSAPTMASLASATGSNSEPPETHNILYIVIAAVAAVVVMGTVFVLRLYFCRSSGRDVSWDEECQDPATKRRRRLKSLVEEKTVRAEYKDYKILQRRRMSTMVSSFDEGSFDEASAETQPISADSGEHRRLHMVVSAIQLNDGIDDSEHGDSGDELCPAWKLHTNGEIDCAVCLGEYKPDDMVCELECGHVFHEDCLFKWFLRSDNIQCPLCRYDLEDESSPPSPPRNRLQSEERSLVGFSRSPIK